MWFAWLVRRAGGQGWIAFTFKEMSRETGIPEQTLRKWHKSATRQGLFRSAWVYDRCQIVYLHAMDIVLRDMLHEPGDCAFVRVSSDLKEIRRYRKEFLYQATTFHQQRASMYAVKKDGGDSKHWETACSSILLRGAKQEKPRVWFAANQMIAGATQESISDSLMVTERTLRRNLKPVTRLRIFQEVVEGDLREFKRKGKILKTSKGLYRTRPNFYLQEDLFEITPDYELVSGRSILRRWKKRGSAMA
jgi:hypothetical protein